MIDNERAIRHFTENRRPILKDAKEGGVNFPLCLAPMVGLSHGALRMVLRDYLPADAKTIWPTEMLNSRKIPFEDVGQTPETKCGPDEDFLVPQILGNEEGPISETIRKLKDWGAFAIDINMGCPVQKALRHNYGVALMGDSAYAAEVVDMTVRNTQLPVSVKLRAVKDESNPHYLQNFVEGLAAKGASWVCLHPRTAEQKRRGNADWEQIRWLRERISIPVVGNGDIQTVEDVMQMLSHTNCDLVMAGRALAARPWLLWQVGKEFGFADPKGKENCPMTPEEEGQEFGKALLQLIKWNGQFFTENQAMRKVRFHVRVTHVWLDFGHTLLRICMTAKNLREMEIGIAEFFKQEIRMFPRTDLRE
ncbi:MAG: tRNA-dihydrouridine synthase family protein [Bdellovibrionota bacterium]